MTPFQTICCFIGGLVIFSIGAVLVLLTIGLVYVLISEALENREQKKLCERRMEGKE